MIEAPLGYKILSHEGPAWVSFGWIRHHGNGAVTLKLAFPSYDAAALDARDHDRELAQLYAFDGKVRKIQRAAARHFGIPDHAIWSSDREYSAARFVAMAVARDLTPASYPELGRMFARDHTSVIRAVKRARRRFPAAIAELRDKLREEFNA